MKLTLVPTETAWEGKERPLEEHFYERDPNSQFDGCTKELLIKRANCFVGKGTVWAVSSFILDWQFCSLIWVL